MENFIAYNPTMVHFGKDVTDDLGEAARSLGKRVLLVYGGGSVLRNGSYEFAAPNAADNGATNRTVSVGVNDMSMGAFTFEFSKFP